MDFIGFGAGLPVRDVSIASVAIGSTPASGHAFAKMMTIAFVVRPPFSISPGLYSVPPGLDRRVRSSIPLLRMAQQIEALKNDACHRNLTDYLCEHTLT